MKYIVFNDKKVDAALFLQLQDLACVLSGFEDLKFQFDFGHYVDYRNRVVTASRFWDNMPEQDMVAGLKTDIYLRTIGTIRHTMKDQLLSYMEALHDTHLKKFAIALFTLLEDLRLEEQCKRERPGTAKWFQVRRREYYKYFESQLIVNMNRGFELDELFCLIYLTLYSDTPDPLFPSHPRQLAQLERIKPNLYEGFEAKNTRDVTRVSEQVVFSLTELYERDCINEYFVSPVSSLNKQTEDGETIDDLKRKNKLENDDRLERESYEDEAESEKLPMWHRESKTEEPNRSFLSFDLESGTKIPLLGGTARETESGDQAMGAVQGKSTSSSQKDYSKQEVGDEFEQPGSGGKEPFGLENRDVVILSKPVHAPSREEEMAYRELVQDVELYILKLAKTIEKTMEHKKAEPRRDLMFGRLSKKLLPLAFEDYPRVFYKKQNESREVDAAFTLLVDCSASMYNKMTDTKKGIAIFHEVLRKLRIPHAIIGFWEDASQVKKGYQPNYFHTIKDFQQSIYSKSGAEIMQLAPQEDNRDGLSIRVVSRELQRRPEKNKFLLVFSDGEPAADGYHQNGIVDTKEAVIQARKLGIEVIGMFLANGSISEDDEKTMQNIYEKEHLLIPAIEELPEQFSALLKKLLLKSI